MSGCACGHKTEHFARNRPAYDLYLQYSSLVRAIPLFKVCVTGQAHYVYMQLIMYKSSNTRM